MQRTFPLLLFKEWDEIKNAQNVKTLNDEQYVIIEK
jgi:hypothetical protein